MLSNNNNSDTSLNVIAKLLDSAKTLTRGIAANPFLASVCFIVQIAAVVVIYRVNNLIGIILFFVLCMIGMYCVLRIQIRSDTKQLKAKRSIITSMNGNTLQLADNLNRSQKEQIREALQYAVQDVAEALSAAPNLLRSNLFGKDDANNMRMILDLTFNMNWPDEYNISMPVGYGSTGRCFSEGKPNIAILREDWGKDTLVDEELKKVHPDLRWIISVPVRIGEGETPPIWVMNVDGLKASANEEKLQKALGKLFIWSKFISLIISKR